MNAVTASLLATPGFVPFAPGRAVGWIVDAATGCWRWTGRHQGTPVVIVDGRTISVARVLYERQSGTSLPKGTRLTRCPLDRECVNPAHATLSMSASSTILDRCAACGRRPLDESAAQRLYEAMVEVSNDEARLIAAPWSTFSPETKASYMVLVNRIAGEP